MVRDKANLSIASVDVVPPDSLTEAFFLTMNREILFRGKHVVTDEWVYGSLYQDDGISVIMGQTPLSHLTPGIDWEHEVDPETVGQYIGLLDRDGTKVFEKDYLIGSIEGNPFEGYISWQYANASFVIRIGKRYVELGHHVNYGDATGSYLTNFKVVGNIIDNPELIKTE